jgi:glycine/D-amino acid oxidase-like deaminating enzyme
MATPQGFAAGMRRAMTRVFPQLSETRIDYAWGGVIDITQQRIPDLGCDDTGRVIYAQGFSGSGVVATMAVAGILERALGGDMADFTLFQRIDQKPFPGGPWMRGPLTAAGMFWYRFLDQAL